MKPRIDLNLLRVFDALFEEGNVLAASRRLHLTNSAVSHALARLREIVGDELFVRTSKGMIPTARALAMGPVLQDCLRTLDSSIGLESFSPENSKRSFVVAANDYLTAVIIAPLCRELASMAPGINIIVRPSTRLDLAEQIDLGRIDIVIGAFARIPDRLNAQVLLTQKEEVLMRAGHPTAKRLLTLEDLARYPLVTVSVGGQEEGAVDGFISERGLARQSEMFDRHSLEEALRAVNAKPRIRLTVPHSLALPALLLESDMLSIIPSALGKALTKTADFVTKDLPYASAKSIVIRAVWHRRDEGEPAHLWLRAMLTAAVGGQDSAGGQSSP